MQPEILIADDHSMIRKGLKLLLQIQLGYKQITEVSSCNTLMSELVKKRFTHLVLDIILSDGSSLEIIPNIRRVYPNMKILIFSMQPSEVYGEAVKQYGIYHYLHKSLPEEEAIKLISHFIKDDNNNNNNQHSNFPHNPFAALTLRELEILHYLLKGAGSKEIGDILNLKTNTVSTMKARILEKTKSSNLMQLVELAALYNVNF